MKALAVPNRSRLQAVLAYARDRLRARPGVVAIELGNPGGDLVITVWVRADRHHADQQIPTYLHGVPVRVIPCHHPSDVVDVAS